MAMLSLSLLALAISIAAAYYNFASRQSKPLSWLALLPDADIPDNSQIVFRQGPIGHEPFLVVLSDDTLVVHGKIIGRFKGIAKEAAGFSRHSRCGDQK